VSDKDENKKEPDIREHLANERTLLAWIRTSIGIMAFGFVVVKFSLFIRQISLLLGKDIIVPPHGHSSLIGILLVVVGLVILILAYLKYHKTEKQIINSNFRPSSSLISYLTLTLIIISILLILYLIENLGWY
jgi:putative membrane protein